MRNLLRTNGTPRASAIAKALQVTLHTVWHVPRRGACILIALYQRTLSPDHGPLKHLHPYGFCKHEPTCSEYGKKIVRERGVCIGGLLTLKRILSCNPWTRTSDEKIAKLLERTSQKH